MKQKLMKLMSLLLCACMVFTMLPLDTFAAGAAPESVGIVEDTGNTEDTGNVPDSGDDANKQGQAKEDVEEPAEKATEKPTDENSVDPLTAPTEDTTGSNNERVASLSGTCGAEGNEANVTWALTQNNSDNENPTYTMTFTGTGASIDYASGTTETRPWNALSSQITKVVIGNGITYLGQRSGLGLAIQEIEWPTTAISIGVACFGNCTELKTLDIPQNVSFAGKGTVNEAWTFTGCTGLETVRTASDIQVRQFSGCTSLRKVEVLSGVTSIGYFSFASCTAMESMSLPAGLLSFGAFGDAIDLTDHVIELPNTVTSLGHYTFQGVTIGGIFIPASVASFGTGSLNTANKNCILYLEASEIPAGMKDSYGGGNASYTTQIIAHTNGGTFPTGTIHVAGKLSAPTKEGYIFGGWYNNAEFNGEAVTTSVAQGTYYAKWIDPSAVIASGSCGAEGNENAVTWSLTANSLDTYTLTISGSGAMADYATGTAMPWNAYKKSITKAVFSGVSNIGTRTLMGCSSLENVEIADSVTSIGNNAFNSCTSLSALSIGKNVTSIVQPGIYLDNLSTLTVDAENSKYVAIDCILYELNGDGTASVLQAAKNQTTTEIAVDTISVNGSTLQITALKDYALSGLESLNRVTLGDSVTEIGPSAFAGCTDLTAVTMPKVETIAAGAFSGCTSLSAVDFPETLLSIGDRAFSKCPLTTLVFPDALTTIEKYAFENCPIETVRYGAKTASIGEGSISASSLIAVDTSRISGSYTVGGAWVGNSSKNYIIYFSNATDAQDKYTDKNGNNVIYEVARPYTIRAVTNGGTFADDVAFKADKLATPTKEGYTFGGWYENAGFNGEAVTTATAGKIYYAKWKELTITFADKTGENAFTYDGTAKPLTATLENTPDAAFTYTYALRTSTEGEGTYGEATATAPTNADYYKVVATLSGTDRTATAYLEIKPADITAATKTVNVKQGDTTPQQLDLSTLELTPNLSTIGTVAYSIKSTQGTDGILDGKPTLVDDKLKFKLKEVVDATHGATVEVTVTPESKNYNPVTVTVQISVTKDTVAPTMSASPTSGTATVIGLQDKIKVNFSKKMIGTPTVAVSGGEGTANGVLAKDGLSMVITPADLANGTTYTFTVNDLTDVAGNALTNNTLTYTTIRQPETSGTAVPTITGEETIITGNADAVPANVTIDYTTEVTTADQAKLKAAGNLPDGYSKTDVFFELVLKVNGVAVKDAVLNRAISITIPYSVEKDTEYKIAHLKADGSVEILDATADITAQTLTFSVKSLSPFMVLSKYNAPAPLDTSDKGAKTDISNKKAKLNTPNTGDSSNTELWLSLLLLSGGALTVFGIYRRKRKKENS